MAQLRHLQSGELWSLQDLSVLGRAERSWIPLTAPCTSGRHAQIIYSNGRWLIFDMNSSNGTRLQTQPVSAIAKPLKRGQHIALGGETGEVFEVVHVHPPEPIAAVAPDLTQRVVGEDGVLVIQAGEHTLLVREEAGHWMMQIDDAPLKPVSGDEVVEFHGTHWTLVLPSLHAKTIEGEVTEPATLVIQHSQDLDDLELGIRSPDRSFETLGARTYSFMLYVLAQRLHADQRLAHIADAEAGWMPVADVLLELTRATGAEVERKHINLHVLRFRKVIERFALLGPDGPRIERRGSSDRIRLAGPVVIEPLGRPSN